MLIFVVTFKHLEFYDYFQSFLISVRFTCCAFMFYVHSNFGSTVICIFTDWNWKFFAGTNNFHSSPKVSHKPFARWWLRRQLIASSQTKRAETTAAELFMILHTFHVFANIEKNYVFMHAFSSLRDTSVRARDVFLMQKYNSTRYKCKA